MARPHQRVFLGNQQGDGDDEPYLSVTTHDGRHGVNDGVKPVRMCILNLV